MLTALMNALQQAPNHEEAARRMLEDLLALTRRHLAVVAKEEDLEGAEVLRTTLHLRPELGYEGLIAVGHGDADLDDVTLSTTAWALVRRTRSAVAVDVEVGRYRHASGQLLEPGPTVEDLGRDTLRRMKRRRATHFVALPLRLPGDQFLGMVTVEVSCPDAAGTTFGLWARCGTELQSHVDLGALYLDRLPLGQPTNDTGPLPAASPRMASVLEMLRAFADSGSTLLLLGESGTGKTRLARWCHEISPRASGPFVVADLHHVPEAQAQARLFGVTRGAFTDATERQGYVEQANGGTLFIDEVSELSPALQLSLLRLLDEGCYQRMGEIQDRVTDIRIIASTNVDLTEAVARGTFRQDLRYRLEMLPVQIPPLHDRIEEIPAWAERFLADAHDRSNGVEPPTLSADAARLLQQLPHEGNLRGVRSLVERAYALSSRTSGATRLGADEIRRAHAQGVGRSSPARVLELLRDAAEALLHARGLDTRHDVEPQLFEETKGVFPGMVLKVALSQMGDAKEAARRLGFGARIRGGNHLETFRSFGKRLEDLGRRLGAPEALWRSDLDPRT